MTTGTTVPPVKPTPAVGTAKEDPANRSPFVEPIIVRVNFYRDNYRRLMIFCLILVLVTSGLIGWVIWERTHKPSAHYYATTNDGKLSLLTPLNQPNLTTASLLEWVIEAATTAYNFNFENYDKALKDIRIYFTDAGYEHFIAALNNARTIEEVRTKRLIVFAVATNTPVITKEGVIEGGLYAWQVQVPMLITYQSASETIKQNVILTMLISRRTTLESPRGVGIASLTVKEF